MTGRVYLVTGAFGVLGSAIASAAAERGARLALTDHAPALAASPQGETLVLGGFDLADRAAAESAVAAAVERFGRLDVLINVAGGFRWRTLEDGEPEDWQALHAMNVQTAANTCRAAIPHLRAASAGRIVNIGSIAALKAGVGMGAYAASKAGVHALTQSLAEELKADGVTVNAVLPAIIDTPANRAAMPAADPATWVAPADLAAVVLFLASEEATAVTGALLPVVGRG